jgi:hypothetical protein
MRQRNDSNDDRGRKARDHRRDRILAAHHTSRRSRLNSELNRNRQSGKPGRGADGCERVINRGEEGQSVNRLTENTEGFETTPNKQGHFG